MQPTLETTTQRQQLRMSLLMNFVTRFSTIVAIVATGLVAPIRAEAQSTPTASPVEVTITAVDEGERAPFSGMLFPTETAVSWRQRIELLESRLTLDVARCEEIARLRLQLVEDTLRIEREHAAAAESSLREALAESEERTRRAAERGWWEAPILWFGVGVVVTVAVLAAIVAAVSGL